MGIVYSWWHHIQWPWNFSGSMEDFLDVRSTPKLSSAVLVTAVFVHVIGFSSIHWSDGGVFYTGLWRACFLTVPGFHCRQDPYSAGESYHNRCACIHHYPGNTHLIESVSAPCWFSNKHYFYRHNETWNKLYIKSLYLA